VPNRRAGRVRGDALSFPGDFHSEEMHREQVSPFDTEQFVDNKKTYSFSNLKEFEKDLQVQRTTWYTASVDYDFFEFKNNQLFFSVFRWLLIAYFLTSVMNDNFRFALAREFSDLVAALKGGQELNKKGNVAVNGKEYRVYGSGVVKRIH